MARVQMSLHYGNGIAHEAKCHMSIRGTLMFNDGVNVAIAFTSFQRPQHV